MSTSISTNLPWELMNPRLAAAVNPLLANPITQGVILSNIPVKSGFNTINHTLGRPLQGYLVILNDAAVSFYDKQQTNQMPDKTLQLHASGTATISLYVF